MTRFTAGARPTRLAYVSSSVLPSTQANSVHVMKMSEAFAAAGFKVSLYARKNRFFVAHPIDHVFKYYGVHRCFQIIRIPSTKDSSLGKVFFSLLSSLSILVTAQDIVYSRNWASSFLLSFLHRFVVHESHTPAGERGRLSLLMFESMIHRKNFKGLVVVTQALANYYRKEYPEISGKILIAPDGAVLFGAAAATAERKPFQVPFRVGYVGSFYPGRGIEFIIELARLCPWASFGLAGQTASNHPNVIDGIDKLENVFSFGYVAPVQVPDLLRSFDVLIAPYSNRVFDASGAEITNWTSPLKIFEYMASGVPIVASDLPVLREVLRDGVNCLLVEPGRTRDWVEALSKLRNNAQLGKLLGATAAEDIRSTYSWSARTKKIAFWLSNLR